VLNTYRSFRKKFSGEYGEIIICHDSPDCWRKNVFSNYKAQRRKKQKDSDVDWNKIFEYLHIIRSEIEENLPYKNISAKNTEADDVIAVIAKRFHKQEKILIISSDKDFQQLQRYTNIKQYSPTKKDFVVCEDPETYLLEHVLRGDSSDGIPNVLSDDDCFIEENKKQRPLTKKKLAQYKENSIGENDPMFKNWNRNKVLVDFEEIPNDIQDRILFNFNDSTYGDRSKILNYFITKKLVKLVNYLEDF
tara:strand:- start:324 stop:1067 length:744 start_codon:yes stop_codon:yes gene_type:complete